MLRMFTGHGAPVPGTLHPGTDTAETAGVGGPCHAVRMMTSTTDGQRPALISKGRAAELLDCSTRTIDRYLDRGLLVAHRDPGSGRVGIELPGVQALAARRLVISA